MATNVERGFALWYEPAHDPQIDRDLQDYRTHMGPNSFYALAPRIPDWQVFKETLLAFESRPPDPSRGIEVSPEMRKKQKGFLNFLKRSK